MAAAINVETEVVALVQRIRAAAADEHEARGLIFLSLSFFQREMNLAVGRSEEAKAALVLEARATKNGGKTVAEQKSDAGALLKKRTEDVSAIEVLEVVVMSGPVPDVVVPSNLVTPEVLGGAAPKKP